MKQLDWNDSYAGSRLSEENLFTSSGSTSRRSSPFLPVFVGSFPEPCPCELVKSCLSLINFIADLHNPAGFTAKHYFCNFACLVCKLANKIAHFLVKSLQFPEAAAAAADTISTSSGRVSYAPGIVSSRWFSQARWLQCLQKAAQCNFSHILRDTN